MGKSTGVARMYQTVVPYAIRHNLYINTKYDVDDMEGLAGGIKKQNGTVLVVWEHKHIHKLLQALGIDSGDKWDDGDYDSIWTITYNNGKPLLTKDKEGISPSANCQ
jgi:bifunctional DNA-binding transcriptional regulator/antitoxin component of YhaV-PrlF toxin-antitoxin module